MSLRSKAFWVPAPTGWMPKVGEAVYVPGGMVSRAVVERIVLPNFLIVRSWYGGKSWRKTFTPNELRPIPAEDVGRR